MGLAWQAYGLGHLANSIHGYYLLSVACTYKTVSLSDLLLTEG
jgi:hypothetical protein